MKLTNQNVLITGGTSGIGRTLALRLASMGNHVTVAGRDPVRLDRVRQALGGAGATIACDLLTPNAITTIVSAIEAQGRGLDLLINNAGIQYNYAFADGAEDVVGQIEREVEVNLTRPLQLTAALLPLLMTSPGTSAIVNVTSGLALAPKTSAAVYCATKAGLRSATRALRYQLAETSVRVVEVLPPLVATPMTQGRGSGKITPEALVEEFVTAFERGAEEIYIGKAKLLRALMRVAPSIGYRLMRRA